jgi:hypothetical protein
MNTSEKFSSAKRPKPEALGFSSNVCEFFNHIRNILGQNIFGTSQAKAKKAEAKQKNREIMGKIKGSPPEIERTFFIQRARDLLMQELIIRRIAFKEITIKAIEDDKPREMTFTFSVDGKEWQSKLAKDKNGEVIITSPRNCGPAIKKIVSRR